MIRALARRGLALALVPLLSGCVVAALPILAAGAMVRSGNVKIRAATPRPRPAAPGIVAARPEMTAGSAVAMDVAGPPGTSQAPGIAAGPTRLAQLPPPDAVLARGDPWQQFVTWSADRAARFAAPGQRSVLLERGTSLALPKLRRCEAKVPAVLIDLDSANGPFAPREDLAPVPGLSARLAYLRAAGVAVLWITALPADRVGDVAEALRASGLDPAGADPLLLARGGDDRKQVLREEANRDVCVIAIAGDRKGDFDELFDYLRDPGAAAALDSFLGAGWFLAPPPLD